MSTNNMCVYGEIRKKYPRIISKYSLTSSLLNVFIQMNKIIIWTPDLSEALL